MKILFLLITILINFLNPLFIKSEENIGASDAETQDTFKEELIDNKKSPITKIHIVQVGDTISSISKLYLVEKKLIIKLNNLKNENYIFVGQNLIISEDSKNLIERKNFKNKESNYHIVQAGENLTDISNNYNLEIGYLIKINDLNNPDSIKVGEKLLLSKENLIDSKNKLLEKVTDSDQLIVIDRKVYGPLTIQSKQIKKLNGRLILDVTNQKNKKLFLSLSCKKKEIDVRIPGRKWRGWKPAKEEFEKSMINDFC